MGDAFQPAINVPEEIPGFSIQPSSTQSFENALEKARSGERLGIDDGVELITTGTDHRGIDENRKKMVLRAADERRKKVVGDEVTFVANLNNNITTACNTGCLFCNFKDLAVKFEKGYGGDNSGFTKTPEESREITRDGVERGVYEVCSVSGLHPALVLNKEHREVLEGGSSVNYKSPRQYEKNPASYVEQVSAMDIGDVHIHGITPEEASHAKRGFDWSYSDVYEELSRHGLASVPGTAAEILVDEVRDVICPHKIDTEEWMDAMRGAARAGLPMTATIMYGHVENEAHRVHHLDRIRQLQDETGSITEFVPLTFIHHDTPLHREMGVTGASPSEDELMIAVSRLYLDNIENIQSSWVKYGDNHGVDMLGFGANDFMGTILSEEITKRAGGGHGEFRSFEWFLECIEGIDRVPVERSTDYSEKTRVERVDGCVGPVLGPFADGTPLLS